MNTQFAWTRFLFYIGSSILLLTEFYRLSLTLLRIIVIAPPLMAILQYIVHWGLLVGFSSLSFSIYKILTTDLPIIDFDQVNRKDVSNWWKITLIISIILIIEILLPPTTIVDSSLFVPFSIIISISWFVYYLLVLNWIIMFWKIELKAGNVYDIVFSARITIHLILGLFIIGYWMLETVSLLILQGTISNIDSIYVLYIAVLILFLINQVFLFYRVTKFSYRIYG